jgi:hypothetical protein
LPPPPDLPIAAVNAGAQVIEVNLENTQLTYNRISDMYVLGKAEELLPQIVDEVRKVIEPPSDPGAVRATRHSVQSGSEAIWDGLDALGTSIVDTLNSGPTATAVITGQQT